MTVLNYNSGIVIATIVFGYLLWRKTSSRRNVPLHPGPRGLWLVGSAFDVPKRYPWLRFMEWRDKYGDVVYFKSLDQSFVVLNTIEAISTLLETRGRTYSERPHFNMIGEFWGVGQSTPLLQPGSIWKLHRKWEHSVLGGDATKPYYSVQEQYASFFLDELLKRPQSVEEHLRLYMGRVITSITYGLPVKTTDSPYVTAAIETMADVTKGLAPGKHLVDVLPILALLPRWIPGTPRWYGAKGRAKVDGLVDNPFQDVQNQMAAGTAIPSVASNLLYRVESQTNPRLRAEALHAAKWVTGSMYAAGGETTYAVLVWALHALSRHPDVLSKLQAEIASIAGSSGLPSVQDAHKMPYLSAVVKETMRWRPIVPLGIPHRSNEDDTFNGCHIPKGSTVIANVWAITREGRGSLSPDEFIPERWLTPEERPTLDPYNYLFGFGPRQCPGKILAINNIYLIISSLVSVFDISVALGEDGQPLEPDYTADLVYYPENMKLLFTPRSKQAIDLIRESAASLSA